MRTITVSVQDEIMQLSSNNAGAAGSYGVVTLEISFGNGWENMAKKLYFYDAYGENLVYILLGPDNLKEGETDVYEVPIPAEPLAYEGDMTLTIKGVDGTDAVIYTASKKLKVLNSSYSEGGSVPAEPTPTQAEILQANIDAVNARLTAAGFILGGDYSAEETYAPMTIVAHDGASFVTLQEVAGVTPTNDGVNYQQFASKGGQGVPGVPGTASFFPADQITATWNEQVAASATVYKTIAHSLGVVPSRVCVYFKDSIFKSRTCIEAVFNGDDYVYRMRGIMLLAAGNEIDGAVYDCIGGEWTRFDVEGLRCIGYFTPQTSTDWPDIPVGTVYAGVSSISEEPFSLLTVYDVYFDEENITVRVINTDSVDAATLKTSVTVEVYA